MALSPLRLVAALGFGGMVTLGLYLTQQASGRPLPAAVAPSPRAAAKPAAMSLPAPPKRIVFRQSTPGDVILTVQGEELVVQFLPASPKAPALAASKPRAKIPLKATPVATP